MGDPGYTHREFDALTKAVEKLTTTIEKFDERMANTYVRKDVYEAEKREAEAKVADLEDDVDKHASYWDWLVKLVVGVVILALLALVITQGGRP